MLLGDVPTATAQDFGRFPNRPGCWDISEQLRLLGHLPTAQAVGTSPNSSGCLDISQQHRLLVQTPQDPRDFPKPSEYGYSLIFHQIWLSKIVKIRHMHMTLLGPLGKVPMRHAHSHSLLFVIMFGHTETIRDRTFELA